MGKDNRQKLQSGAIRKRNEALILKAAVDEFVQYGYKGASVQSIANRVDLPKANVLYYFKSKKGLYFAVLEDILTLWNQGFSDTVIDIKPADVIEHYIRGKMKYSKTHPKESKIFALELIHGAQNINDAINLPIVDWTDGKISVIQSWIKKGLIRSVDPLYLLFLIWGTTQFYADCDAEIHMIKGRSLNDDEFEKATQFVIDTVLKGLDLKKI